MRSFRVHKVLLPMAAAVLLSVALGAVLERKLDLISAALDPLRSPELLPSLEINSDPNLEDYILDLSADTSVGDEPAAWQASTRGRILELGGSKIVPDKNQTIKYRTLREKTLPDGTSQKLIAFETFDGSEIPAYLHVPPLSNAAPGILVIPGHVSEGQSGIEQLVNEDDSYQHSAARLLAAQGYVTITPELRGFGYLGQPYHTEHRMVAYNAVLKGTSYKWIALRDLGYAMALLRQLDVVDGARIGVTGASLGGELAVAYGALDTDVDAVVFQSFGGSKGPKQARRGGRDDQPHYCHTLPVIDTLVAQEHWFWLLAPRRVLGIRGSDNHPFDTTDRALYAAPWDNADNGSNFELRAVDGGHEYFVEPAAAFFANVFGTGLP